MDGRCLLPRGRFPGGDDLAHRGARGFAGRGEGVEAQRDCFVDEEPARAAAASADVTLPFGGVPIGVKELDPVKGWPQTEASLVFKDRIAEYDGTMTARLQRRRRRAGRRRRRPRSSAASTAPTPGCTGRPRTPTTSNARPAAPRVARPPRWPAGCFPSAPGVTAAGRSESRPASPACSG